MLLEEPVAEGTMVAITLEPDGEIEQPTRHPLRKRGSLMGGKARPADRDPRRGRNRLRALESLSDEALLAIIATPDGELALAELYDRYGKIAYGLAYRVLRDSSLAEDAVQGVHHRLADGEHVHPRARRQAPHVAARSYRRAVDLVREQRRRMPATAAEEPPPATPAAENEAALRDRRRAVQAALTRLPADRREALELAYYGGLTQTGSRSNSAFRSAPSRAGCSPAYTGFETCSGKQASKPS